MATINLRRIRKGLDLKIKIFTRIIEKAGKYNEKTWVFTGTRFIKLKAVCGECTKCKNIVDTCLMAYCF